MLEELQGFLSNYNNEELMQDPKNIILSIIRMQAMLRRGVAGLIDTLEAADSAERVVTVPTARAEAELVTAELVASVHKGALPAALEAVRAVPTEEMSLCTRSTALRSPARLARAAARLQQKHPLASHSVAT